MKPTIMKLSITTIIVAAVIAVAGVSAASPGHGHDHGKEEPKKEEAAKKEGKAKPYTLDTCIVSDEKLGEMGRPVAFEHNGQEIKLCCKDCRKDFDKDPAKYLKKLGEKK